jgi:hypothetical protein
MKMHLLIGEIGLNGSRGTLADLKINLSRLGEIQGGSIDVLMNLILPIAGLSVQTPKNTKDRISKPHLGLCPLLAIFVPTWDTIARRQNPPRTEDGYYHVFVTGRVDTGSPWMMARPRTCHHIRQNSTSPTAFYNSYRRMAT